MITTKRRRALAISVVLAGAVAAGAATAWSAPALTFKLRAVSVPGYPETGNHLGAGAMIQGEAKLTGTEYDGFPAPLTNVQFQMPAGTRLHPQGFATCAPSVIEQSGPQLCPKASVAGPGGSALGAVSFGGERVPERASIQLFFSPGGDLTAFIDGTTPTVIEKLAAVAVAPASPPYGLTFTAEIPLIETVPEAPYASALEGTLSVGAAYKRGRRTISYVTLPQHCPDKGWPTRAHVQLLGGATAEASYSLPCPRRSG
jgi:hypothetical protein